MKTTKINQTTYTYTFVEFMKALKLKGNFHSVYVSRVNDIVEVTVD